MAVKAQAQVTLSQTVDVSGVTRHYLIQASTATKPAKPTVKSPTGWTTTEPTYTTGSTKSLYACDETVFSDGTWTYSDVSLSSSYEAAKAAYNKAVAAQKTAAALSKLIRETEDGVDVGKSADGTAYADGTSVTRQGTGGTFSILKALSGVLTTVASFGENLIELGKNSTSAIIRFCGGKGTAKYENSTMYFQAEDGGMVALASRSAKFPLVPSQNPGVYAASIGGVPTLTLSGNELNLNNDLVGIPFERFATAIQPVVLYNGGAALNYDVAPGSGTTGTVTLSESAANFRKLTLYLLDNTGRYAGAFPIAALPGATAIAVGQTCDAFGFEASGGQPNWTFIRRTRYTLASGTTLVPSNGGYVEIRDGGGVFTGTAGVNYLKIYRVTGRR